MEPKDLKEAELSSQLLPRNFPPSSLGSKKANTEPSEDDKKYMASKKQRLGINNALKRITSGGYGWYIKSILWQPKKESSDFEKKVGLFLVMLHGGISGIMESRQGSFGKCIQTLNCSTNLYLFITLTSIKFSSHSFNSKALDGSVSYHFQQQKQGERPFLFPQHRTKGSSNADASVDAGRQ